MAYKKHGQSYSKKSYNNGVKAASFIYGLIDGSRQEKEKRDDKRNKERRK